MSKPTDRAAREYQRQLERLSVFAQALVAQLPMGTVAETWVGKVVLRAEVTVLADLVLSLCREEHPLVLSRTNFLDAVSRELRKRIAQIEIHYAVKISPEGVQSLKDLEGAQDARTEARPPSSGEHTCEPDNGNHGGDPGGWDGQG
jgi:hypothetical protein